MNLKVFVVVIAAAAAALHGKQIDAYSHICICAVGTPELYHERVRAPRCFLFMSRTLCVDMLPRTRPAGLH